MPLDILRRNDVSLRFAYRCMMQAHKMLKPSQPKRGIGADVKNLFTIDSQIFIEID